MQKKTKVDVALWAGLIPENAHDPALLQSLLDHGAAGFKSFMSPAGLQSGLILLSHNVTPLCLTTAYSAHCIMNCRLH